MGTDWDHTKGISASIPQHHLFQILAPYMLSLTSKNPMNQDKGSTLVRTVREMPVTALTNSSPGC